MRITKESIAKMVFGSKVKRRILEFLFAKQEAVSERQLSRIIGVSHTAVNKAMRELLELNIVKAKSIGAALIWEVDTKSFAYPYVKAFIEASKVSPLDYIKTTIRDDIETLNSATIAYRTQKVSERPLVKDVYIFGSVAEGTATPESDIDVLVVLEFDYKKDVLKQLLQKTLGMKIMEKIGNKISFHIYTVKEVEKAELPWLKTAVNHGIRVYQ